MARPTRVKPLIQPAPTRRRPAANEITSYPSKVTYCIKYSMFFMNVLFWIISCIILAIASYAMYYKKELYGKISNLATDPAVILALAGVLMFVISFGGCLGALRENVCLLRFYSIMLGLMLLLEIVAAVLGYVYAGEVKTQVQKAVDEMVVHYRDDPDLQNIIDMLQKELKCCGVTDFKDWERNVYFNCSSPSVEKCGVPFSCCISDQINSQCGFGVIKLSESQAKKTVYTQGCMKGVQSWLMNNLIMMASIAASLPALQIMGYCFARRLIEDIQDIVRRQQQAWN